MHKQLLIDGCIQCKYRIDFLRNCICEIKNICIKDKMTIPSWCPLQNVDITSTSNSVEDEWEKT